jgi:hypothetical protein
VNREQKQKPDADGIYVVRVYESLVNQLRAAPSDPVTVTIEERGGRELMFVFTRHDCPSVALSSTGGGGG